MMASVSLGPVLRSWRSAFVCAVLCVVHLLPWSWASGQDARAPLDIDRLGAAIEEVQRSPLYGPRSSAIPAASVALGYLTPVPVKSPAWVTQAAESDSTFSTGRVLLMSWGAAALSDVAGFYFGICADGGSGCVIEGGFGVLAMMTVPVLGTAAGAKLAGAPFLPALAGSAAGLGIVVLQMAMGAIVDPDDSFLLFIAIPSFMQAGITTLVVSAFN